jgi:hypothetical protein
MPIMGFIIPLFIIGIIGFIPMLLPFGIGIAFIMLTASYAALPKPQGSGWRARMIPLLVRRSVSPFGGFSVAAD